MENHQYFPLSETFTVKQELVQKHKYRDEAEDERKRKNRWEGNEKTASTGKN
jgi:hypothetical protein